jgi:hypothetical protein
MYSVLPSLYVDDDYTEEYGTIIGQVDSYDIINNDLILMNFWSSKYINECTNMAVRVICYILYA